MTLIFPLSAYLLSYIVLPSYVCCRFDETGGSPLKPTAASVPLDASKQDSELMRVRASSSYGAPSKLTSIVEADELDDTSASQFKQLSRTNSLHLYISVFVYIMITDVGSSRDPPAMLAQAMRDVDDAKRKYFIHINYIFILL